MVWWEILYGVGIGIKYGGDIVLFDVMFRYLKNDSYKSIV